MKRIVCLILIALMLLPAMIACAGTQNGEQSTAPAETSEAAASTAEDATTGETAPEQPSETPAGQTEEPTTETPAEEVSEFDADKFYEIRNTDGERLEWNSTKLKIGSAVDTEGTFWSIKTYVNGANKTLSVFFAGDGNKRGVDMGTQLRKGGKAQLGNISYPSPKNTQSWMIKKNEDGLTYKIVCGQIPNFALKLKDGVATLEVLAESSDFSITEIEFVSEKYSQWISEKGNLTVRLPIDVVDQIYKRLYKTTNYKDESAESLKGRIYDRMQLFAESAQKCYDSLIDLTGFTPYEHIVIYAFEHQGVMAGVVGADPNIYVNVDWYVDDMTKMMQRWDDTKGRKEDYNFCILHEMGHMFDWGRGWNFESEMQTDFKASYVLYSHRNDEFGAWAAPAEYGANEVFNIDTLDTGAYKGLSSNMRYEVTDETITYTYSIYRSAQMYTAYIKYCEETDGLRGFEAMKEMFHWFQDQGLTVSSNSRIKRFVLFNQKLEEFTGKSVAEYMVETAGRRTWPVNDWYATVLADSDTPCVERKNDRNEGTGVFDVKISDLAPETRELLFGTTEAE